MSGPFTRVGKEVLGLGYHYADAADEQAAVSICDALNGGVIGHWQPIETAGRGEDDDVFLWNGVSVIVGNAWESGWVDRCLDWIMPQPTHWQPVVIPSPPSEGR
jgi:hypothetical protein